MELERKLKTALDESRLLILGAQVLFGFQFQSVFQNGFAGVEPAGKVAQCVGLLLLLVATGLLIAASVQHQIVYAGETRRGALDAAAFLSGASLLPLTLGLGASIFTALGHAFGRVAGVLIGSAFALIALSFLYGLGIAVRNVHEVARMPEEKRKTPLSEKIEQLLTEARVIIPGGQALLGFQLIATLTERFAELPYWVKIVHAAGLCAVALAVILLMTPAALHRVGYGGENHETFFRIGSALVIAAAAPLAIGISSDVLVVFYVVSAQTGVAATAGLLSLAVLFGLWFAYPMWRRLASDRAATRQYSRRAAE